MPGLRTQFAEIAREAGGTQGSFEAFLAACLRAEVESRREHRLKERLKQARFLHKRTLEDFDFSLAPSLSQALVLSLAGGEFVKQKENVILPPAFRSYSSNCLHLERKIPAYGVSGWSEALVAIDTLAATVLAFIRVFLAYASQYICARQLRREQTAASSATCSWRRMCGTRLRSAAGRRSSTASVNVGPRSSTTRIRVTGNLRIRPEPKCAIYPSTASALCRGSGPSGHRGGNAVDVCPAGRYAKPTGRSTRKRGVQCQANPRRNGCSKRRPTSSMRRASAPPASATCSRRQVRPKAASTTIFRGRRISGWRYWREPALSSWSFSRVP